MKIAYVLDEDISTNTGVVQKIMAQIKVWESLGHKVHIFSLISKNQNSIIKNGTVISVSRGKINFFQKIKRNYANTLLLDLELQKYSPDIIYSRYMRYSPNLVSVLKNVAPYIVELNSNDVNEYKQRSILYSTFNTIGRTLFYGNASAFVSVSVELSNDDNFTKFNKKTLVLGNSIDIDQIRYHKNNTSCVENVVFIGTPKQIWHGIDKCIYMANKFPNITFHIIGPDQAELDAFPDFQELSNIVVYGYLEADKAQHIVSKCDIGISSLALHRKEMNEASPLKSRMYLAQGLPIITGYQDTDFEIDTLPFVLNIGNNENNVRDNIAHIKQFFDSASKYTSDDIIKEARRIFDLEQKENKRLDFFEEVLLENDK